LGKDILYVSAATAASAGLAEDKATRVVDVRRAAKADAGKQDDSAPAVDTTPAALVDGLVAGTAEATAGLANMMGGTTLNTRLLIGIVILVLGILILVYPALLPLIAGISLIVIGLWIALQNATGTGRP
jgi:thiol:disulfide interchange protein